MKVAPVLPAAGTSILLSPALAGAGATVPMCPVPAATSRCLVLRPLSLQSPGTSQDPELHQGHCSQAASRSSGLGVWKSRQRGHSIQCGLDLTGWLQGTWRWGCWRHGRSLVLMRDDEAWVCWCQGTHSQGPGHLAGTLSQASIPLDLYPGAGAWGASPGAERVGSYQAAARLSSAQCCRIWVMLRDLGVGLSGSR